MNPSNIRNFAIIAHVDHGKSTLADRLLEKTKTISKDKMKEQFLDQNPISRERGITIKLAPVRMVYKIPNPKFQIPNNSKIQNTNVRNSLEFRNSDLGFADSEYILNLIDTPGHVDFSYEVSRTLAACEGAILLVDATQGVQAQTVAHFYSAKKENLTIIPVINKIDLPTAKIEETARQLEEMFGFKKDEIINISAKSGENVDKLLEKIIEKIPPPKGSSESLKALIFDAFYDEHRGVIVYVRIVDGIIKKGDRINFFQSNTSSIASEVGYFIPNLSERESISVGEIGYIVTGVKDIRLARVGDTIYRKGEDIDPLTGYSKPKPMVFFGMYPKESSSLGKLRDALNKISLNDTSITFTEEYSSFLGSGYRVGFLGLLHAEIIKERMENEERLDILLTMPHVLYEEDSDGHIREPYIALTIYTPKEYVGSIISLCENKKGKLSDLSYFQNNAVIKYEMPYTMLVRGIASDIKSLSSGFATIDYEHLGFKDADLVNIEILINGLSIDILSERVYRDEALYKARQKTQKLKETLPRQQFRQIIQAVVGGNILAREEISPYRKDVLAKMSGGDRTRKDKLLEAQKKGKAKLNQTGKVSLPQEVLYSLIKS